MIINHNMMALNTHRQLTITSGAQSKSMEKLSSGYRINRAGDDAAGLSISEKMRGQIRGLQQASRNSQDGISLIQTAEGALSSVNDMLVRIKELSVQAINGTYDATASTGDLARVQDEVDQLATQIVDIRDNTKFNGIALLNTSANTVNIQIGQAAGQTLALDQSNISLADVATAVSGYSLAAHTTASTALADIENQIVAVSKARSYLGANQNRLEYTIKNLDTSAENLQSAESRIRDVDMAKEMMEYTKQNILQQAATAMLAQANQAPQGVLQLLK